MVRANFCVFAAGLLMLGGCGHFDMAKANAGAPVERGFVSRTITIDKRTHKYAVFVPHDYTAQKKWPTVLFLHGLFEGGDDGVRQLSAGLAPVIAADPKTCRFIAIFPQTSGSWDGAEEEKLALQTLAAVERDYAVDGDRVILSGFSKGGHGVWEIGAKHGDRFAALIPLCPEPAFDRVLQLVTLPIWSFHNSGDPFIKAKGTQEMCRRIEEAGGRAKFTEYNQWGHDCWTKAWTDPMLMEWMMEQRRTPAAAAQASIEP
jgi:predicted peptidase